MAPPHTQKSPQKEGRMDLAIHGIKKKQFPSRRRAAWVCKVSDRTLGRRLRGIRPQYGSRSPNRLLSQIEEDVLIQWILHIERRGFPPWIIDVKRLAERLIYRRGGSQPPPPIGKLWVYRFLSRHPAVKARLTRRKDSQRARQERPSVIRPWFQLVQETIERYGIVDGDKYNFDETGFAMGLITGSGSSKAVGSSDNVGRITISQPGDRTWMTGIECPNALGWMIPPFIIAPGKVHLRYWYDESSLPKDMVVALSENGWTNDDLGLQWLKHFDKHTKDRVIGTHRLLILDGHGSHITPEFDNYCTENRIVTICMPPHTSHLLQPLDVGCFGAFKTAYGKLIQDLARRGIFHIDKADFLAMYCQAHKSIFTESTIKNSFKATGLIPFDPEAVLSKLIATPSPPGTSHGQDQGSSPIWTSETPKTQYQLAKQSELIKTTLQRASQSPTAPIEKLTKGYGQLIAKSDIHELRILELEQTVEHLNKKKKRKSRTRLQSGGILVVGDAQEMIRQADLAAETAAQQPRTRAPPTCSNCHQIGHTRTRCPIVQYSC
jgi:DDE superfamily endonuclease/Tc5 transposase DNA-binding domain